MLACIQASYQCHSYVAKENILWFLAGALSWKTTDILGAQLNKTRVVVVVPDVKPYNGFAI